MSRISDFIKDALSSSHSFYHEVLYGGGCEWESQSSTLVFGSSLQNWEVDRYCFIVGSPNSLFPWMHHRASIFSSWGLRGLLEFAFAKSWLSWASLDAFPSGHVEFSDIEENGVPTSPRGDANSCGAAMAFPTPLLQSWKAWLLASSAGLRMARSSDLLIQWVMGHLARVLISVFLLTVDCLPCSLLVALFLCSPYLWIHYGGKDCGLFFFL